jgi:putative colanic acid biosynthesis acetyltransferase WcaF
VRNRLAMNLDRFDNKSFERGRSRFVEILWYMVQEACVATSLPGSGWRVAVLRLFGATIGRGVVIKPRVRFKFPWRLHVGDYTWIGEAAWIDNLGTVRIGNHCCISQGVYFCTGNHDWASRSFDLFVDEIQVGDSVWIAAGSVLAPGCKVGEGAVVGLGAVARGRLESWTIYQGNPAAPIGKRNEKDA